MFVSGFTIVRNAIKYDYPVFESISSVLPMVDEMIVLLGNSEDQTKALIQSIGSPKIKIYDSTWDDSLRKGGKVLALETNKAFAKISERSDWGFYIQADEVIHEKYHQKIRESMLKWKDDSRVEGLLFDYRHFYGSYDYIADSRKWYRREVRIIRNEKSIYSFRDAQGFQKEGRPLKVKHSGAEVYHYGWVKPPEAQQLKQQSFHKLWHDDDWMKKNVPDVKEFDYGNIDRLSKFTGEHPLIMQDRIRRKNWHFQFDPSKGLKPPLRIRFLNWIEKVSGWRIGEYRNYKIIR